MSISLSQALKKKKRLVHEIQSIQTKIQTNNSILATNTFITENDKLLAELELKKWDLIDLKLKIFKANLKIYDKILEMGEAKSHIQFLRAIDTSDGDIEGGRYGSETIVKKKAQLTKTAIETEIKEYETKIESLQDIIDEFNAKTKI